jgi:DNA-binding CsgD family transcriptional regulator
VVHRMKARERRLAAGLLQGRTQAELASQEGISQSAVSQSLQRSGASALRAGLDALEKAGA